MRLTWFGTASLIVQQEDTVIAFDPFCKIPVEQYAQDVSGLRQTAEFQRASRVFVTHGHFDHIYFIPRIYQNCKAAVYCTAAPYKKLLKKGVPEENLHKIAPGWSEDFGSFKIRCWQSRHCRFDAPLLLSTVFNRRFFRRPQDLARLLALNVLYREKGEILFYELECAGIRVQIMGSMNLDPDTEYPTGADVLVLPFQGRSDQDQYALRFIERLKPGSVLLDHYDDSFPPLSADIDTSGFVRSVRERFQIVCSPLEIGRPVHLQQGGYVHEGEEKMGRQKGWPMDSQHSRASIGNGAFDAQSYGL